MSNSCNRCSACCSWYVAGKKHTCRMLVRITKNSYLCRVYSTRLGRVLHDYKDGRKIICTLRINGQFDYPGCPQNSGKPMYNETNNHDSI